MATAVDPKFDGKLAFCLLLLFWPYIIILETLPFRKDTTYCVKDDPAFYWVLHSAAWIGAVAGIVSFSLPLYDFPRWVGVTALLTYIVPMLFILVAAALAALVGTYYLEETDEE